VWLVFGCFLVPACVYCPLWVVGVGAFWVGHKRFIASRHTVGFTFNTVLASAALDVVVARAASWVYWCGLCVVGCL